MGETQILDELYKELRLDTWWMDLLGQQPVAEGFDYKKAMESIPRTELTSGEEIHRKLKNRLSYSESLKRWYIWDGNIHTPCEGEGIATKVIKIYYRAVKDALAFVQKTCYDEASRLEAMNQTESGDEAQKMRDLFDKGEFKKHRMHRDRLATEAGLAAMTRVIRTECDVAYDYFDTDQRWFVVRNGVIDLDELRQGNWVMKDHSPERAVTKFFDADYDPTINLGYWDRFLETSIPNKEARDYLQKVVGAAFMGQSKLRCIPNLYGPPGSGKSVFINTFFRLAKGGAGYAVMPDSRAITKVSGQNFEQDKCRGARFIGISEPSHSEPIDDDFLKKYTGDVWVETRTLNAKSTGWVPQGVIFVASNKPLRINTRDKAIVERVQMIQFPITFTDDPTAPPEHRRVYGLEELLAVDDAPAVLHWLIMGMYYFMQDGLKLNPPQAVLESTGDVVTEASTALRFVKEYIESDLLTIDFNADPDNFITLEEAYMRYTMWAQQSGEHTLTKRFFQEDIINRYNKGETARHRGEAILMGVCVTKQYLARFQAFGLTGVGGRF